MSSKQAMVALPAAAAGLVLLNGPGFVAPQAAQAGLGIELVKAKTSLSLEVQVYTSASSEATTIVGSRSVWIPLGFTTHGCGSKIYTKNGILVNGNMDQNLRSPGGVLLTHTHMFQHLFCDQSQAARVTPTVATIAGQSSSASFSAAATCAAAAGATAVAGAKARRGKAARPDFGRSVFAELCPRCPSCVLFQQEAK